MVDSPTPPAPWWRTLLEQPIVQRLLLKTLAGGFAALALYANSPAAARFFRDLGEDIAHEADQVQPPAPAPPQLDGGAP